MAATEEPAPEKKRPYFAPPALPEDTDLRASAVFAAKVAARAKSLELLYDYTKFHIGVYLSMGSALIALMALRRGEPGVLIFPVHKPLLMAAVAAIAFAGCAGGVIVSSITQSTADSSQDFLDSPIGPWRWKRARLPGLVWTEIEHSAFWIGLALAVLAVAFGN